jgi:hypothetical protein
VDAVGFDDQARARRLTSIRTIRKNTCGSWTISTMRSSSFRMMASAWSKRSARRESSAPIARILTARPSSPGCPTARYSLPTATTGRASRSSIRMASSSSTRE